MCKGWKRENDLITDGNRKKIIFSIRKYFLFKTCFQNIIMSAVGSRLINTYRREEGREGGREKFDSSRKNQHTGTTTQFKKLAVRFLRRAFWSESFFH